jgi:endonuclease G
MTDHKQGEAATWVIPIEITVRVGSASPQTVTASVAIPATAGNPVDEVRRTRKAIQEDPSAYYDEEADLRDRESYYASIPAELSSQARFDTLAKLLKATHTSPKNYAPSQHLYPLIDLHPNGELVSIYSGASMDVEAVIRADAAMEQAMEQAVSAMKAQESFASEEAMFEAVSALEANFSLNCEHVVPQSWFKKREPMKGDLHHLFACEQKCNGFRGNVPYFDFPDFEERVMQDCGRLEGAENRFEPRGGKGAVARATLYFFLRYPKAFEAGARTYTTERLSTLISWHNDHPVTLYEHHRNRTIQQKQGNRNPLIDHPEWAEQIDFTRGL